MILQKSQSIYMLMLIYAIIISMSNYEYLSANSQDIKTFKLKQKIKNLLILLIIGIPIALGFAAYLYYKSITKNKETAKIKTAENSQHTGVTEGVNSNQDLSSNSDQQLPGQNSVSTYSPNSATQNNSQSSSSVPVSSSTSNIPSEVVTALNYTETNGVTNNPYIDSRLDTSQFTNDAKITFDRSTWILQNTNQGSIDFTIKLSGVAKNGTSTLSNSNGTWKIIGYAIKD